MIVFSIIIRTIFFWLFAFLFVISVHIVASIFSVFYGSEKAYRRCGEIWARFLLWIGGVRVEISGQENIPPDENVIIISNHQV